MWPFIRKTKPLAKTIFVSHTNDQKSEAIRFKELLIKGNPAAVVFLSSDWESIRTGSIWIQEIESALRKCDCFIALIITADDAKRLWVNYEVGFARGRGLFPLVLVFGQINPNDIPNPLSSIQLLMTGDTNRWFRELESHGLKITAGLQAEFASIFRQNR